MGPVAPGAQLSQNHWSIYLIHSRGSVRLNMLLENPSAANNRGVLTVANYGYTSVSTSAVMSWDFTATVNLSVWHVLDLILNIERQNYDMTDGGMGCRYWTLVARLFLRRAYG